MDELRSQQRNPNFRPHVFGELHPGRVYVIINASLKESVHTVSTRPEPPVLSVIRSFVDRLQSLMKIANAFALQDGRMCGRHLI